MKAKKLFDQQALNLHYQYASTQSRSFLRLRDYLEPDINERILLFGNKFDNGLVCNLPSFIPTEIKIEKITHAPPFYIEKPDEAKGISRESHIYSNNQYDLIISCLSLQFSENPLIELRHYYNLLKEGGVFICVFFGGTSLRELRAAFLNLDQKIFHGAYPHIIPMIDVKDAGMLAQKAGFNMPVADSFSTPVLFKGVRELMYAVKDLGLSNCLNERNKAFPPKNYFELLQTEYQRIIEKKLFFATVELITLTGRK